MQNQLPTIIMLWSILANAVIQENRVQCAHMCAGVCLHLCDACVRVLVCTCLCMCACII